jgi:hypothetical protein
MLIEAALSYGSYGSGTLVISMYWQVLDGTGTPSKLSKGIW